MGLFDWLKKDKGEEKVEIIEPEIKVQQENSNTKKKKSNKRKTLVKEFDELVKQGDKEAIKQVFKKCDINAYGGVYKTNALGFPLSEDMMIWLVEQGADVNYRGSYQKTPLHILARDFHGHPEYLIRLKADIEAKDSQKETPLFSAVGNFNMRNMKVLVEEGADINAQNISGDTPLLHALKRTRNANIPQMLEMVEYFIERGAKINVKQKEQVKRIGTDFEWYRNELEQGFIDEIEPSLMKLYELYDVDPVPKRVLYDGGMISVQSKRWQEQHEELWQLLVPAKGHASTMQGEVIRISGRLSYEILDNGRINWDNDYKKMTEALSKYLKEGNCLKSEEIDDLISKVINDQAFEKEMSRLTEMCVGWVIQNPSPIPLNQVTYKR